MDWFTAENSWLARMLFQRSLAVRLPGRLRRRREPVPRPARRARPHPGAAVPRARCRSGARPASSTSTIPTGSSSASPGTGPRSPLPRSRGSPTRCPWPRRCLSGSCCGSSTSRSSTSVRPGTASAGSRCCWRRASWRSSWATHAPQPPIARPLAAAVAAVPPRVRRRADQAARRPVLARPDLPVLPPRDPADARPAQLVVPPPAPAAAPHRGAANHVTQLVVPFGTVRAPAGGRDCCRASMIVTQLWLVASGNFAWLNWLTIVLALSALADSWLAPVLPGAADHAAAGTPSGLRGGRAAPSPRSWWCSATGRSRTCFRGASG